MIRNCIFGFTMSLFAISCNQHKKIEPSLGEMGKRLTETDRHLCDSLHLDSSIVQLLRRHTADAIEPFHYSLSKALEPDGKEIELDPVYGNGFVLRQPHLTAEDLVATLCDSFHRKGYTIFMLEDHFSIGKRLDVVGILNTIDKYTILKKLDTNGVNWDIDNDSVIHIIKGFDKDLDLQLVGANGEYCEFIIRKSPADWKKFAKSVYKICPDVVDQGTGTVDALEEEMRKSNRLYLWWD